MNTQEQYKYVSDMFDRSIEVKKHTQSVCIEALLEMADVCIRAIENGNKIMLCGNGGSAADAQHLAAELLVRLRPDVNRQGLPAIALAMDTSSITACGNDYSYEVFYRRMVEALGQKGDVLLGITTSGRSANIIQAFDAARDKGIHTLGMLGGAGEPALSECDYSVLVPCSETGRVQESHILLGHALMELIEEGLKASGFLNLTED